MPSMRLTLRACCKRVPGGWALQRGEKGALRMACSVPATLGREEQLGVRGQALQGEHKLDEAIRIGAVHRPEQLATGRQQPLKGLHIGVLPALEAATEL